MTLLPVGPATTLLEDIVYALPARACLATVQTDLGTIEVSNDQVAWTPITLDVNGNFQAAAQFIRCVDDDAIISIKTFTVQTVASGEDPDLSGLATVAYVDAQIAAIAPGGENSNSALLQGGQVIWLEDYVYRIAAAVYTIQGTQYSSPETDVTLDASDPTDNRLDALVLTTAGTAIVVTGTAEAQPSVPVIDPGTQFLLTPVLVTANTTEPPDVSDTLLYLDNAGDPTEWDWTNSGASVNVNSSNNPFPGATKSIEFTNAPANAYAEGEKGTGTFDVTSQRMLILYIRSKGAFGNNRGLQITLRNAGVQVGQLVSIIASGSFGFDSSITSGYQLVAIPIQQFAVPVGSLINQVRISKFGSGATLGCYLGNISFQANATFQQPIGLTTEQANALFVKLPRVYTFGIGNNVDVIATGVKRYIPIPKGGTIYKWTIVSSLAAVDATIELWRDNYPTIPNSGDKITASAPIELVNAQVNQSTTLTGWSPVIPDNSIMVCNVATNDIGTEFTITLELN